MGRVALGSMAYVNGRLSILMSANDAGEDERPTVVKTQNYAISCWITFLENPNAPAGGRFVFTDPVFLDYGIPNPGQMESGEFTFPLDVWRQSSYYDRTHDRYGYRHVTPGTAMCKLVPQGPNGPELVRVSLLLGEPSAADRHRAIESVPEMRFSPRCFFDPWQATSLVLRGWCEEKAAVRCER